MQSSDPSSSSLWRLETGKAIRLPQQAATRRLRVREGKLWLTTFGDADRQAVDFWLGPGDEMTLPDGQKWVAEGWPSASFEILVAPTSPMVQRAPKSSAPEAPWQRWLSMLQRRRTLA
ncbi:hypothetical protein BH09PSE5_BH09PSE5_31980 [soil metagenome]